MTATFIDRVFNSTLTLPQQLILRALRVARGDADFLSERGFKDAALIPFAGIVDDHINDVTFDEAPELLGIKNAGFATKLAVAIGTDPLSFLSVGATGAARAAQSVNKFERVVGKTFGGSVDDFLTEGRKALEGSTLGTKARNRASGMLREVESLRETQGLGGRSLKELRTLAAETEPLIALPFGVMQSNLRIRVPAQHSGWATLMAQPFTKGSAWAVHGLGAVNAPVLSPLFRQVESLGSGFKHGGMSRTVIAEPELPGEIKALAESRGGVEKALQNVDSQDHLRKILEKRRLLRPGDEIDSTEWRGIVSESQRAGDTLVTTARKVLTGISDKAAARNPQKAEKLVRAAWRKYRTLAGLDPDIPLAHGDLAAFLDHFDTASKADHAIWEASIVARPAAGAFNEDTFLQAMGAYKLGESARRWMNKTFLTGADLDDVAKARKDVKKARNSFAAGAEELNKLMGGMVRQIAKATGTDEEVVERSIFTYFEGIPRDTELQVLARAKGAAADPKQFARFASSGGDLDTFLDRVLDAGRFFDHESGVFAEGLRRGLRQAGIDSTGKLGAPGTVSGELREAANALKKWIKENDPDIIAHGLNSAHPTDMLIRLENALQGFQGHMLQKFYDVAGEAGERFAKGLEEIQAAHLKMGRELGTVGETVPLGHLGRILTRGSQERVANILGEIEQTELGKAAGIKSAQVRKMRSVTAATVNEIVEKVRKADLKRGGKFADKLLSDLKEGVPELAAKLSLKPHVGLIQELGQMKRVSATGRALDDFLKRSDAAWSGEIIGHGIGNRVTHGSPKWGKQLDDLSFEMAERVDEMPTQWVAVKSGRTGQIRIVELPSIDNELRVVPIGTGRTAGEAAGSTLAKMGKFDSANGALHDGASRDLLDGIIGEQLLVGNKGVINSVESALGVHHNALGAWFRTFYDPVHAVLKAGATVVRPDFHLFNFLSGAPMLHMEGASMRNIFLGLLDARTIARHDPEFVDNAGRMARMLGDKPTGFQAIARQVRLSGTLDDVRDARAASLTIGDEGVDILEDFRVMAEEGLLNTHAQDIAGGLAEHKALIKGGKSQVRNIRIPSIEEIRDSVLKGDWRDKRGRLRRSAAEVLSQAGDHVEIMLRYAGYRAFLRQGFDPVSAARASKRALIDYTDFTDFEQAFMSRAFSFYKFPRKMIPASIKAFANNPAKYVTSAKTLYNLPNADTTSGDLRLNFDDYQVNLQRAVPALDGVSAVASMADWLLERQDFLGTPESTSPPVGLGIPIAMFIPNGDQRPSFTAAMQDAFRISYATRWALTSDDDPLKPQSTIFDKAMSGILGVKKPGKARRQSFLVGHYKALQSELERRVVRTDDPDERADLIREARRLGQLTSRFLAQ